MVPQNMYISLLYECGHPGLLEFPTWKGWCKANYILVPHCTFFFFCSANVDIRILLDRYQDVDALVEAFTNIPYTYGSGNLADALKTARTQICASLCWCREGLRETSSEQTNHNPNTSQQLTPLPPRFLRKMTPENLSREVQPTGPF